MWMLRLITVSRIKSPVVLLLRVSKVPSWNLDPETRYPECLFGACKQNAEQYFRLSLDTLLLSFQFSSYLNNRRQKVEVNSPYKTNFFFDWGTLKHGIPQGSIPRPLLIIIYTNEFSLRLNSVSELILFSVDTSVVITSRSLEDFSSISNYFSLNIIKWSAAIKFLFCIKRI